MSLHEYVALLRRSWLLIVVATILGVALGAAASWLSTPVYRATAQMFVSVQSAEGDGVGTAYTGGLFVQQRILSYTELVSSPGVLDPVMDELDLDSAPQVEAASTKGTVLIEVSASDGDPQMAAAVADATAESLGAEIERLETTSSGDVPVKVSVTSPAEVPEAPISPNTKLNLALGLFLGLGVGVSIALLRHTLDTTVKQGTELTEATGATVLGSIGFDSQAKSRPLVALDKSSPRSEAFRTIRTNLQYVDVDNPPKAVVVTSSVPGEGKTTTACNLAITLAQSGQKVLLVEADLRLPRVADYLGIDGSTGLTDVLVGRSHIDQVIVPWNRALVDVLPSGPIPPNPSELLGSHQMSSLLDVLRAKYDVILLDAPPLLPVTDAAVLGNLSDGAIVVARYGSTKREQVTTSAEVLHQVNGRILGVVLNFVPVKSGQNGYGYGYGYGHDGGAESDDPTSTRGRLSDEDAARGTAPAVNP